jgi:hypothetical protein
MAVSSIANIQNRVARSLVAARSARGPFASALASATSSLSPANSTNSSQSAAQQSYNQSLSTLQGNLNQWFQAAGVDTSQEIQLSLTADGTVQLNNNPANAAQIQQVLQNHPELGSMFESLSNAYQQLNPPNELDNTNSQFIVTLSGGTATAAMSS